MENSKPITSVPGITSVGAKGSFFVSDGTDIKQISKEKLIAELKEELGITALYGDLEWKLLKHVSGSAQIDISNISANEFYFRAVVDNENQIGIQVPSMTLDSNRYLRQGGNVSADMNICVHYIKGSNVSLYCFLQDSRDRTGDATFSVYYR